MANATLKVERSGLDGLGTTLMKWANEVRFLGSAPIRTMEVILPLELSPSGLAFLKLVEALRTRPYDDQTGLPITSWCRGATIGYGHLISRADWPRYRFGISQEQAEELLLADLAPFVDGVVAKVQVALQQHQVDALTLLAFNIGLNSFRNSSVLKMINGGRSTYPTLEAAWKAWNKSQGQVMQGLVNRRAAEWTIYSQGVYPSW